MGRRDSSHRMEQLGTHMFSEKQPPQIHVKGVFASSLFLLPHRIFQAYLLISLWLFSFGPVMWKVANPAVVWSYALLGQAAILIGFTLGIARPRARLRCRELAWNTVNIALYASVAVNLVRLLTSHGGSVSVMEALTDPNVAYSAHGAEILDRRETSSIVVLAALCGPFLALAMAVGMVFWHRLTWRQRAVWTVGVALHLINGFLTGTAKNLFDVVLLMPLLVRAQQGLRPTPSERAAGQVSHPRRSGVKKAKMAVLSAAVLVGGMAYFYHSRLARYGGEFPTGTVGWSADLWGLPLPEPIEYGLAITCGYLCQGYYGLSGCLELPFVWSWGVGHSSVLSRYAGTLFADAGAFRDLTYPVRYEAISGYRCGYQWHTIYPWLASDLTFPGALAFIAVCAWLLARAWRDTLEDENPFAAAFFSQVALLFFFIPMNSSRLAWSEELVAFWSLLLLWQMTATHAAKKR